VRLISIVKQLNEKMIEMDAKINNYEKENNELKGEINQLKKENNELKNELNEIKNPRARNTVSFSREPERYERKDNLKMSSAMKDVYPTKENNLYQQERERQERERQERERQERERQEKLKKQTELAKSLEKKEPAKIMPEDSGEDIKEDSKEDKGKSNTWNDNDIMNWNAEEEMKISEEEIKEHHAKKRMINTSFFKQKNADYSSGDETD
jgi:hypothetical protein